MSHRIVYDFAAVKFQANLLAAQPIPEYYQRFYDDHYLFFELGGDNNMTMTHPKNGREVRERQWLLLASGKMWEVMREVVGFAASCEGGGMRLTGEKHTLPETYIKKVRNTLKAAAPSNHASELGLHLSADLRVNPLQNFGKTDAEFKSKAIAALSAIRKPKEEGDDLVWSLFPLLDNLDAALFFSFNHLDLRSTYNKTSVSGDLFPFTPRYNLFDFAA